jgi:acyl-CoA synthetase (AMP-forming)/AMP-acid ligase II
MNDPAAARTCPEFLRAAAERFGSGEAVVLDEAVLTFEALEQQSAILGRGLLAWGVGKGCRVGFIAGNGPQWVVWWAAITRIGAIAIPLSTFVKADELVRVVRRADLHGLFVQRSFLGQDLVERVDRALPELAHSAGPDLALPAVPFLRWIAAPGDGLPPWVTRVDAFEGAAERFDDRLLRAAEAEVHPQDPAIEIYTSGITALPKGATHTHGALMTKTHHHAAVSPFEQGSHQPVGLPLFWVGGLMMLLLPALECGAAILCTESTSASSRSAFGSVVPNDVLEALPPRPITWALGMTETLGPYSIGNVLRVDGYPLCPPLDAFAPGFTVKVVSENGEPVGDGEVGEILVRGPTLTIGLHKVARPDAFDDDGYYRTGDLGQVEGARIHFVGRKGDMIKTSGANVAPAEVEMELQELPGVDSAYVVGLADDRRGQVVVAAIVAEPGTRPDPEAIRTELRTRLSTYKVPRKIVFIERDEVPMTASNKVHKQLIADLLARRINGERHPEADLRFDE